MFNHIAAPERGGVSMPACVHFDKKKEERRNPDKWRESFDFCQLLPAGVRTKRICIYILYTGNS